MNINVFIKRYCFPIFSSIYPHREVSRSNGACDDDKGLGRSFLNNENVGVFIFE